MKTWKNDYGNIPRWWWLVAPPRYRSRSPRVMGALLAVAAAVR